MLARNKNEDKNQIERKMDANQANKDPMTGNAQILF